MGQSKDVMDRKPLSDIEIIDHVRRGARNFYTQIIDRYKDKSMSLALRILRNREEAEEAIQDAFIRAYNALNSFEGTSQFGTWFYRILYNVCLTRLSRRTKQSLENEYDDDREYETTEPVAPGWADEFEMNDMIAFVKKTIDLLPAKYSAIVSLFYFQELSYDEIARVTELPIGTVKTHLFRARTLLQKRMQKELQYEKTI
jgi:RNA polymerase sigma factor (sigma-70 family)